MENASKALIMAGSVLIGMIILALLVAFFNNLRQVKQADVESEQVEQAVEYNKQYEVYNRTVYGSELLSLAHKVEDYNIREADAKDYQKIELEVTIKDATIYEELNKALSLKPSNNTYTASNLTKATSATDGIEKETKAAGDEFINFSNGQRRKIKQLANMRDNEIRELADDNKAKIAEIDAKVKKYNDLKSFLTTFKEKKFKLNGGFEYDNGTGRITKMKYILN